MIPIDGALLARIAGRAVVPLAGPLAAAMARAFPIYGVTGLDRQAIFLAQAAHETDGFHTLEEYADGHAYEGRGDLGNVEPGDGPLYKGRGIFMLTGRANYRAAGRRLGVPLEDAPGQAAEPELAVAIAGDFWKTRGLAAHADVRDFLEVTRRINGGFNGIEKRADYWMRAWLALAGK